NARSWKSSLLSAVKTTHRCTRASSNARRNSLVREDLSGTQESRKGRGNSETRKPEKIEPRKQEGFSYPKTREEKKRPKRRSMNSLDRLITSNPPITRFSWFPGFRIRFSSLPASLLSCFPQRS